MPEIGRRPCFQLTNEVVLCTLNFSIMLPSLYVAAGEKGCQTDTLKLLAESDTAEIGLRRIAA